MSQDLVSGRRTEWDAFIEIASAVMLALATLGTAWSSYQASSWSSLQSAQSNSAHAERIAATRAATAAGQLMMGDLFLFVEWLDARAQGFPELAAFYEQRFRDEFRPAFDAWLATDPLENPSAPSFPVVMPEYALETYAQAEAHTLQAEEHALQAQQASARSSRYILLTVLFASVLFFAGVSPKFRTPRIRVMMLALGFFVLASTALWLVMMPVRL